MNRELEQLYAQIPRLDCKGLCPSSCGPIECSERERELIERQAGKPLDVTAALSCSMLTDDGRCSVYAQRPMLCRLWGAVERMKCPWGCKPDPGYLTDEQGGRLLRESLRIGGQPPPDRLVGQLARAAGLTP